MGAILAENTAASEQDIAFNQITLDAYTYTSKIVRVSYQLLQDSAVDIEDFVGRKMGERVARILNQHFTTGTGTNQPRGIVTAAASGKVGASGQTTSITYDDIVDLVHAVDPAYRGRARFMLSDSSVKALKKLKATDGSPLWVPGTALREPDTLLGYGYTINQDMPSMAANAKSILFGDLSKYLIRNVKGFTLVRMAEKYAEFLQVGFMGFARYDGDLLDAGANPIKFYQNSAS